MPGQFPTTVDIADISAKPSNVVLQSRTVSQKRQSRLIGGHLWRFSLAFNLMSKSEFKSFWAFLENQDGPHGTFTIILPGYDVPLGAVNGSPTYTSTTNDNEIVTGGWAASITDQVKAGDVFTIAGDTKVYTCIEDMDSDGSGNGSLKFKPALQKTPSGGAALTFSNVAFTVNLARYPTNHREGVFYVVDPIEIVEAL